MSDSEFNPPNKNVQDWREQADKQLSRAGKTVDDLITQTPEGIDLNPLYTADDLAELDFANTMPTIIFHNTVIIFFCMFLNCITNITNVCSWFHYFNTPIKTFLSNFY